MLDLLSNLYMKIIFCFSLLFVFSSFQSFAGEIIKTKYSYIIDKESVIENNCPCEPCTSTTVDPDL